MIKHFIPTVLASEVEEMATINDTNTSISGVIATIINYSLFFIGIAAISGIVFGGILLITSAGNPEKAQKAKRALTWSIAGIIIVILAFAIVTYMSTIVSGG